MRVFSRFTFYVHFVLNKRKMLTGSAFILTLKLGGSFSNTEVGERLLGDSSLLILYPGTLLPCKL